MKVLHLCLAAFYIDNYSYQENMLPKYHKKMGLDVEIIASLVSFDENGESCLIESGSTYNNEHDIPVTRLNYKKSKMSKVLRQYERTYESIKTAKPDIIFIHGCQFYDIRYVVKYLKENPSVKVFVDNHADFSNSATNWYSKNILHKILWKRSAHLIEPYTSKFYGVLPARVEFLKNIYKIPEDKIELLVMGADDEKVKYAIKSESIAKIRDKHNIRQDDFLIITGGKIDNAKRQTLLLMEAVKKINDDNVKLIIFGSVIDELKDQVKSLIDRKKIKHIGWIKSQDSYKYFAAADLAVFPGRHSVLWEQAVGTGTPCIFKYWKGTTHVDLNGNCRFLYKDNVNEIYNEINTIRKNTALYNKMKFVSMEQGINKFSYKGISSRAISMTKTQNL